MTIKQDDGWFYVVASRRSQKEEILKKQRDTGIKTCQNPRFSDVISPEGARRPQAAFRTLP
jgi:hypothetical protein